MSDFIKEANKRWAMLEVVQKAYPVFSLFYEDVVDLLGLKATELQEDIGAFIEFGGDNIMVGAGRGEGKTTIVAAFAVYTLIHSPSHRVVIISATGTHAKDIATMIIRIIKEMPVLECLRPDRAYGDRTGVEGYDLHHSLKGVDKSPSVACIGVGAGLPGKRADLLIIDDAESDKNAQTSAQRAKLLAVTYEFNKISVGRTIYLGTYQTTESIYLTLPSRGVNVRLWPARYPTPAQMDYYGSRLAPFIRSRIEKDPSLQTGGGLKGDQGQPTDPIVNSEARLQRQEMDSGTASFQLHYMLNPYLNDLNRFALATDKCIVINTDGRNIPTNIIRGMSRGELLDFISAEIPFQLSAPHSLSKETNRFAKMWAYIDPAAGGANGDETAYAVGGFSNGNIIVMDVGGVSGGYDLPKMHELAKTLAAYNLDGVTIEKNMGYGAFAAVFTPILRQYIQCQVDEDLVTTNKERRIINTLAPIIGRGSLIFDESVVSKDNQSCLKYPQNLRSAYSLFYQMNHLTEAKGCLIHDDRIDALEGLCRHFKDAMAQDQEKVLKQLRATAYKESIKDPIGHKRYMSAQEMAYKTNQRPYLNRVGRLKR